MNDDKGEAAKAPRRERRTSENPAEGKKEA